MNNKTAKHRKNGIAVAVRNIINKWSSFNKRMPIAGKFIIAMLLLTVVSGGAVVAYSTYDFTQNNPDFCNKCHIMTESFSAWKRSIHANINCHDCHKLAVSELNTILASAVLKQTDTVPVRYDKIIVPWKTCMSCHWEENEAFPDAVKINSSRIHARHYFMEKIECSKCHGYNLHEFNPDEQFCLRCHKDTDLGHNKGMAQLPCLNCHTDRTVDLKPDREKCLICHGGKPVKKDLINGDTIDVSYFIPSDKIIESATKINSDPDSPMQFHCNQCHKPHDKIRPEYGTCVSCHSQQLNIGMHGPHITDSELVCVDCHEPHSWRITEEVAKEMCAGCHDYIEPTSFLSRSSE